MSPLLKNLTIALVITTILFVGYMIATRSNTGIEVAGPTMNPELWEKSQKILRDTNRIDAYRLNVSILSDVRFLSLQNTTVDLASFAVEPGRPNPFAPTSE